MAQTMVCDSAAAEVGAWGLQIAMTLSLQPVVSLSLSLPLSVCVPRWSTRRLPRG